MSAMHRPFFGRVAIGVLAAGATIALSACLPDFGPSGGTSIEPGSGSAEGGTVEETPTEAEDTDVFTMAVGDCYDDVTSGEITELPVVDCAQPHDNEIYYSHLMEGDTFPGEAAVTEEADTVCEEQFAGFVGVEYLESDLYYTSVYPTSQSWTGGDREILCAVYNPTEKTTGSLAGSMM